jgi:predicted AAA+ superfamily ATPase
MHLLFEGCRRILFVCLGAASNRSRAFCVALLQKSMQIIESRWNKMDETLIPRPAYLDWLRDWRHKNIIKVVTGVRRCGKSTLFRLYMDWLLSNGVKQEQIISVNLEALEHEELLNYHALYNYIAARLYPDGYTYVFIDEAQCCENYEKVADSLFLKDNVDVHITGSNAYLLSGELATLLSGRYVTIEMLPLSFAEYISFTATGTKDASAAFRNYLKYGAFPAVTAFGGRENLINSYLDGIYNTILLKDVAARLGIDNVSTLESIVKFLLSNIGSSVSEKNIANTLQASGKNISTGMVEQYLRALCDAYLFYQADRYDIRGKQHLRAQSKYYAVDSGLRELLLANSAADLGHMLENIVFLELLRRNRRVSVGKLTDKEVDFVAEDSDGLTYYQVSASVLDEKTLERELAPLRKIPDHHPKILLTLDEIPRSANYNGIRQLHVVDWLLSRSVVK